MKLLAADPGETTGVVILENDHYSFWQIDSRDLSGFYNFLCGVRPDGLLYEQFHYRPNLMKAKLYSMQVIGVLRLYAQMHSVPILFTPIPSEAKKFWTDDKIKAVGLWQPGKKHATDALRVLLKYRMDSDALWFQTILPELKEL